MFLQASQFIDIFPVTPRVCCVTDEVGYQTFDNAQDHTTRFSRDSQHQH